MPLAPVRIGEETTDDQKRDTDRADQPCHRAPLDSWGFLEVRSHGGEGMIRTHLKRESAAA